MTAEELETVIRNRVATERNLPLPERPTELEACLRYMELRVLEEVIETIYQGDAEDVADQMEALWKHISPDNHRRLNALGSLLSRLSR